MKETLKGLSARSERTLNLLPNLFKAYEMVNDENFLEMIRRRKNACKEGDSPNLSPTQFMDWARLKYQALLKNWQSLSEHDQTIIALEAQVKRMAKGRLTQGNEGSSGSNKTGGKVKQSKAKERQKETWQTTGPSEGVPEEREVNGKTYYWCKWHEKWSLNKNHTSTKCSRPFLTGDKKKAYDAAHPDTRGNEGTTPALRLANALADLPAQEESSDEE